MVGQAGAGSSRTDQPQGTPPGGQRGLGSLLLPAPACQHPDQAPESASQRGLLRTRGRRARTPGRPGLSAPRRPTRRATATIATRAMAEVDPDQAAPCDACAPPSASSWSCGSSTTTTARAKTTRSPSRTASRQHRPTGRVSSPAADRCGGTRPACAGSDRAAAARRWPSSRDARPRYATRDTRGR